MKILFINPPYTNFEGIAESAGHMMPLSFGYLAAYARKRMESLEFRILDAEALGLTYEEIVNKIAEFDPHVVGITAPTPAVEHVFNIAKIVKEYSDRIYVVLGGVHPTVMPEQTLKECDAVDLIVAGEGEETFFQLLESIRSRSVSFENVEGLYFRYDEKIIKTAERDFIKDLDDIPFPARDLYELELYRSAPTKKVSNEDATPILTSRGCPYNCIHCPSRNIWHKHIRYRSADNIADEIEECVNKYGLKEFNFFDDTFTINKKRVIDICNKIIERGLNIYWICFSRTNTIDDELVRHLKAAGCRKISLGLESGDQRVLDLMRKKTTVDAGRKAVQTIRKYGIPVHASFMFGNVGETETSIIRTIDFATSLDLDNATFFTTTPFPGTDLYDIAKDMGNITEDTPWNRFAPLTNTAPILVQDSLTADELVYWQKQAFRKFYLNPGYVMRKLKGLASMGGAKTLLEGFRVFLRIIRKGK